MQELLLRKKEVQAELDAFVSKKQIDPAHLSEYTILMKKKVSPAGVRWLVQYIAPDGMICPSKNDVVSHFTQKRDAEARLAAERENTAQLRLKSFEEQRMRLAKIELPETIDDYKVISFGTIDARPEFSTEQNIYPLNYCAEFIYTPDLKECYTSQSQDGKVQPSFFDGSLIRCEVLESCGGESHALYRITRLKRKNQGDDEELLNERFEGPTEADAWEAFDPEALHRMKLPPSFFNFEIELLLEGLDNAHTLQGSYQFHYERGYPQRYRNAEEFQEFKTALITKGGRSKRSAQRKNIVTAADRDRLAQVEREIQSDPSSTSPYTDSFSLCPSSNPFHFLFLRLFRACLSSFGTTISHISLVIHAHHSCRSGRMRLSEKKSASESGRFLRSDARRAKRKTCGVEKRQRRRPRSCPRSGAKLRTSSGSTIARKPRPTLNGTGQKQHRR